MARSATLKFSDMREEKFHLIIGCTGKRPNWAILKDLPPDAISEKTSQIVVRQISKFFHQISEGALIFPSLHSEMWQFMEARVWLVPDGCKPVWTQFCSRKTGAGLG
ncbi:hypothetical protein COCMIDRAFT_9548 [Bipolaris oryzae ATCC 44560]|uniref:Uncharacterized protein n=1 Tax=Bipolaris oryzae ATCC 44560 TaxID=930090 RepID=W6YSK2_COCMI|nr:uncharacterized protein COCMIDRAFT_9548 [Bipolaris oryzae ATCC 44560]EUC40600.1 hypothetical protein COCMIDRAFT_9548 [Bipolaris oryzae ATCC 44560]